MRNGTVDPSSSTASENSDGERLNGFHHPLNGVLVNGYNRPEPVDSAPAGRLGHRTRTSKTPPNLNAMLNGVCLSEIEEHNNGGETRANMAALEQMQLFKSVSSVEILDKETRPLVVNHSKLRDLLSRAVVKTERCEVELLEKFYALLAQCIYRHRNNHNKTALLQEMKKEIDSFS